jgi:hypothetical protein
VTGWPDARATGPEPLRSNDGLTPCATFGESWSCGSRSNATLVTEAWDWSGGKFVHGQGFDGNLKLPHMAQ